MAGIFGIASAGGALKKMRQSHMPPTGQGGHGKSYNQKNDGTKYKKRRRIPS